MNGLDKRCDNCGRLVARKEVLYEIKIDIYAKGGPVEIDPEDLEKDHLAEMERLLADMEEMDTEELTDQVFESYRFNLCNECREEFHARLKLKATGNPPRPYRKGMDN